MQVDLREKHDVREQYVILVVNASPTDRDNGKLKLTQQDCFINFMAATPSCNRLQKIIIEVLDGLVDMQPSETAQAFDALENYAFNLIDYPWKKEIRIILTYSGFFKTTLEPFTGDPVRLLSVLGYTSTDGHKLQIPGKPPEQSALIDASFDFFLAAAECRIIESIVSSCPCTAGEVYKYRRNHAGGFEACLEALQSNCRVLSPVQNVQHISEIEQTDHPMTKLGTENELTDNTFDEFGDRFYGLHTKLTTFSTFTRPTIDVSDCPLTGAAAGLDRLVPSFSLKAPTLNARQLDPAKDFSVINSPEFPKPVSRTQDVDELAAILKDISPDLMEDAEQRRQIMSRLHVHSPSKLQRTSSTNDSEVSHSDSKNERRRPHTEPVTVVGKSKVTSSNRLR